MKKLALIITYAIVGMIAFAQEPGIPQDTGHQILREISVDTFDDPTLWKLQIPIDRGIGEAKRIYGGPNDKKPLKITEQINEYNPADEYVYGIRIDYFARNNTQIGIQAVRPIYVPGIAKKISVWVSGRGKGHTLSIVLRDMKGNVKTLPLGDLKHNGWKKLETTVPIEIDQEDKNSTSHGLYIIGFTINTKFEDTVGRYYVYFDDIRALSDVMNETHRREDDIQDGW